MRVSDYINDKVVELNDQLFGTDSANGRTRNFLVSDIVAKVLSYSGDGSEELIRKVLEVGTITTTDTDVTINPDWVWAILGDIYSSITTTIPIEPLEIETNNRYDLIVLGRDESPILIQGIEAESPQYPMYGEGQIVISTLFVTSEGVTKVDTKNVGLVYVGNYNINRELPDLSKTVNADGNLRVIVGNGTYGGLDYRDGDIIYFLNGSWRPFSLNDQTFGYYTSEQVDSVINQVVNTKVSAEEQARIDQAILAAQAAKAYADAKADLAEVTAKAYADGIVDSAEARAIADATAKADAARAYAEAADLLLKTQVEALEDGIVTEIEAIKLTLAEEGLDAAKEYVDAQALAAEQSAKAYADGIITEQEQIILDSASASVAAAKAYADAAAQLTLEATKAYADGIVDASEQRILDQSTQVANAAKFYAEAQDKLLREEIKSYADGIITAEEQVRIAQSQAVADAAKAYADAAVEAQRISSEAYADGVIDGVEARAITAAQGAVDTAKAYAVAQDLLLQTSLQAYADGIVDAEEQARIDQANANVLAAQAYAEAQAEATRVIALAYADGVITEEEARAIADANAKLQEAKDFAQGLINEILPSLNLAIAQAQNALDTANAAKAVTNFLVTTVDGNVISTGTMQVGDVVGANAGISGVTDESSGNSVRFWAGATYANRKRANWLIKDNGTEEQWINGTTLIRRRGALGTDYFDELYNTNGTLAKRTALVNGKIVEEWYNNGELFFEVGQTGIVYVEIVPESFVVTNWYKFTATDINSQAVITEARNHITTTSGKGSNQGLGSEAENGPNNTRATFIKNKSGFTYNAGKNVDADANKVYNGFVNTKNRTDTVPDGVYAYEQLGDMPTYFDNPSIKLLQVMQVVNGKIVDDKLIQVQT